VSFMHLRIPVQRKRAVCEQSPTKQSGHLSRDGYLSSVDLVVLEFTEKRELCDRFQTGVASMLVLDSFREICLVENRNGNKTQNHRRSKR